MSEASPSLGGHPAARLPHYAVADRVVAERLSEDRKVTGVGGLSPTSGPADISGLADAAEETGAPQRSRDLYERGGYGGLEDSLSVASDAADLTDLSHSLGDGARYAVDVSSAREHAQTPAARAAKLRLRQALLGVRRVCQQAMRQRMHTEMADLASQIRKMHDRDSLPR